MTARGGTWRWPGARRRSTAITVVTRMALGVLRVGRSFVTARISPGIEVGHRIHNAPTELTKLRPSADHALLLQRARRQPQVIGGFIVGQVALGLCGRGNGCSGRPSGSGSHRVNLHRLRTPGHTTRPAGGSLKKDGEV